MIGVIVNQAAKVQYLGVDIETGRYMVAEVRKEKVKF